MNTFDQLISLSNVKRAERSNSENSTETKPVIGVAMSDSNNGTVLVDMRGDSVTYDGSQAIPMETTVSVKIGDKVLVLLSGSKGSAKSPLVIGVVSGGDRTEALVNDVVDRANSGEFDGVVIYMNSSKGWSFKNNEINTELSVIIYHGSTEIKTYEQLINDFGTGTYLQWSIRKHGDADFTIVSSSDSHLSENSFKYTVSPDDVDVQCVFNVQIITAD